MYVYQIVRLKCDDYDRNGRDGMKVVFSVEAFSFHTLLLTITISQLNQNYKLLLMHRA